MDRKFEAQSPQGSVERDFLAFSRDGDVAAMERVFHVLAPRLLVVAAHVARDSAEAEDLVQTTFLVALRDTSKWDPKRPLLPWLLGILSHRAVDLRRRETVRRTERLGDVASALDPADLAEDSELRETLASAVERLQDPYREVLILRLVHGLEPVEIAHALGRAPELVRVQLSRGRERLRRALPQSLQVPAFLLADIGPNLADVRVIVLAQAKSIAAPLGLSTGLATGTVLLNGVLTMKAIGLGACALALGALAWMLYQGEIKPTEAVASDPDSLGGPGLVTQEDATLRPQTPVVTPQKQREVVPSALPAARGLQVRVRFASDGSPAEDVGVYVRRLEGIVEGHDGRTDAAGMVSFDDLPDGPYFVSLDRVQSRSFDVTLPIKGLLQLSIPDGIDISGQVQDLDSNPIADADIYRFHPDHHDRLQWLTRSDVQGAFELRDIEKGTELIARAAGYQPSGGGKGSGGETVRSRNGEGRLLVLQMGAKGHRVRGHVRNTDGSPAVRALVVIAVDEDAREETDGVPPRDRTRKEGKAPDLEGFLVRTDENGEFSTDEVPRGSATLFARSAEEDERVGWTILDVAGEGEYSTEIVLDRGARVFGRVADATGAPLVGLEVYAEWEGDHRLGQTEDELGALIADRVTRTDEDGRYSLVGLLPGEYDLDVEGAIGERRSGDGVELKAGGAFEWNPLVAPRRSLTIRVENESGTALSGWGLGIAREGEAMGISDISFNVTDTDGQHIFQGLRHTPYLLALFPPVDTNAPGWHFPFPVLVERVHDTDKSVTLQAAPISGASIFGKVQRARLGEASPDLIRLVPQQIGRNSDASLSIDTRGMDILVELDETGSFSFTQLTAGSYELELLDGQGQQLGGLGSFTLKPAQALDAGTLRPQAPAEIEIGFVIDDGSIPQDLVVQLSRAGEHMWSARNTQPLRLDESTGLYRGLDLPSGSFELQVFAKDLAPAAFAFELVEGKNESFRFTLTRGSEVQFEISFLTEPQGPDVIQRARAGQGKVDLTIFDSQGRILEQSREEQPFGPGSTPIISLSRNLAPGTYQVWVEDERYDGWDKPRSDFTLEVVASTIPRIVPVMLQ